MFSLLWILFATAAVAAAVPCFEHLESTPKLLGAYRPQCQTDGSYHRKQCHGSTGYCWCVTPHGKRRLGPVGPGIDLNCVIPSGRE